VTTPSNLFICGRNVIDDGTLSTSVTPYATMPVNNLKRSSRARVWRSSSAASVDIVASLASTNSERVNFVCLSRHNLESAAQWQVQLYPTYDASGAALYDSGMVAAYSAGTLGDLDFGVEPLGAGVFDSFLGQKFSVAYFNQNIADVINSIRVTVNDPTNSYQYVEASRLFAGRGVELLYNWDTLKVRWNEDTKQDRSDGGTLQSDGSLSFREIEASLKWVDNSQRAYLLDLARLAGMRKDLFLSVRPGLGGEDERDHTMICRLTAMPDVDNLFFDVWSSAFKFGEL
jgi:uncharacterized protein (DUF2164 family)